MRRMNNRRFWYERWLDMGWFRHNRRLWRVVWWSRVRAGGASQSSEECGHID